jgi:MYXO-CTERM domain-containing protein
MRTFQTLAATSIAGLFLAAGPANAAFLSFASDTSDHAWTFTGSGANVTSATGQNDYLTLNIDDNNGPLPTIQVSTRFTANYTIDFAGTTTLPGGGLAYSYAANGSFSFADVATGTTLFTVNFTNALFSTRGSASAWSTTAALQGDNSLGGTVSMTWNGANLAGYGLSTGGVYNGGFGFDLSALNSSGAIPWNGQNPGVGINGTTRLPSTTWFAEGSFSATTVPTPSSLALLGIGGLVAARRRRS